MKTVFCPIDFTGHSNLAAKWATMISIKSNRKLVLFNKFNIFSEETVSKHPDSERPLEDARKDAEKKLLQLKYELCKQFKIEHLNCTIETNFGIDIDEVIVKAAEDANAGMIVMGTEGAESFGDVLWGSNTTHVINQTNIPVLVVPETAEARIPGTFVYASDLLNEDVSNLTFVLDLAKDLNARVIFLHINQGNESVGLAKLKEVITGQITELPNVGKAGNILFEEIKSNDLYSSLEGYADKKDAGLIILGRHKRNFFEKLLKGDLSRFMALYSYIPLLILHKKD
jgi:nucleotide-binding universal stress UspA family protein